MDCRRRCLDDPAVAERAKKLNPNNPINIQFTSGTTGTPKGATLTHRNILNNGYFIGEAMNLIADDRLCIPVLFLPLFGMVLGNLAILTHGGTIVYPNDGFDPITVLETVQKNNVQVCMGYRPCLSPSFDHPDFANYDLSTLRTGIMAGQAVRLRSCAA